KQYRTGGGHRAARHDGLRHRARRARTHDPVSKDPKRKVCSMSLRYNLSVQRSVITDAMTRLGDALARYGLVIVIVWFGAMKFTSYEAQGIQPLVAHSPLMSWVYDVVSVSTFSALLG